MYNDMTTTGWQLITGQMEFYGTDAVRSGLWRERDAALRRADLLHRRLAQFVRRVSAAATAGTNTIKTFLL